MKKREHVDIFHPQFEPPQQIEEWKNQIRRLSERKRREGNIDIIIRLINHIDKTNQCLGG